MPLATYVEPDVFLSQLCIAVVTRTTISTVSGFTDNGRSNTRNLDAKIPKAFSTIRRARDRR
jgi:hypothetical protein